LKEKPLGIGKRNLCKMMLVLIKFLFTKGWKFDEETNSFSFDDSLFIYWKCQNRSKEQLKTHLKHPNGFITTVNKNSKRKGKQQVTEDIPTQNFQEYYLKSKDFQGEIEKFFIKLHYKLNISKEYLNWYKSKARFKKMRFVRTWRTQKILEKLCLNFVSIHGYLITN